MSRRVAADKFRPHHAAEYAKLLEWASGALSILEIGSRFGYTLIDLAHAAKPGARVVAVDLPGAGDWGNADSEPVLRKNVAQLRAEGYDAHLFLGDSASEKISERVAALGPFDFVFIDGDHRYDGVLADWLSYGPLGARVAFHDIRPPAPGENQNLEVWRLWREISASEIRHYPMGFFSRQRKEEFIAPDSKMGIGLVN